MKSHISVTLDDKLVEDLNRFGQEERRSHSQIIDMSLEEFLCKRAGTKEEIVTSPGRCEGRFSREETRAR